MKSFLAILILSVSLNCLGQSNYSIADTSKSWSYVHGGIGSWGVVCGASTNHMHFQGDTMINGNLYLKVYEATDSLYSDEVLIGFLHEDTLSREVYYRNIYGDEGLIYDFSLESGDTVFIVNYYEWFECMVICWSIDSVLIGDQFKDRYNLYWDCNETWIEDMGSLEGVLSSGFDCSEIVGGFVELLCYKYNDSLIYSNPGHQRCHKDDFYPHILSEYYDTGYVNVPYSFQAEISDTSSIDSVYWIAGYLPPDFTLNSVTGILEGLPSDTGSFSCGIIVKNWHYRTDMLSGHVVIVNPTGINSISIDDKIALSPNPCKEKLFLDIRLPKDIKLNIIIYDVRGQVVLEKTSQSDSKNEIDCHSFPSGIYFIKIEDTHRRFIARKKFVKM